MRDWVTNVETTFYIIGTVAGPHPYPMMVRDFQCVIGRECIEQMPRDAGRQPDAVIACVGGGSNAMGIFHPYIPHEDVQLIGVEAAGEGIATGRHSASLTAGRPGVLHGNRTYLLQDEDGQIIETHSISAGLDYPGVGPEHAWLKDSGRARVRVDHRRRGARGVPRRCCRIEGIIPALESRARARLRGEARADAAAATRILLVNLSGRGDKDMNTVAERSGLKFYCRPECDPASRGPPDDEPHRHLLRGAAAAGRTALIPYVTAGDPCPAATLPIMHALVAAGADIIELGVPFSDPMADGPVIQRASERALAQGTGLGDVLAMVARVPRHRRRDAGGADGLRQPDRGDGPGDVRRPGPRRGSRRRAGRRLSAGGGGGVRRAARRARARADLPAVAHDARRAHRRGGARSRAATSTTCR